MNTTAAAPFGASAIRNGTIEIMSLGNPRDKIARHRRGEQERAAPTVHRPLKCDSLLRRWPRTARHLRAALSDAPWRFRLLHAEPLPPGQRLPAREFLLVLQVEPKGAFRVGGGMKNGTSIARAYWRGLPATFDCTRSRIGLISATSLVRPWSMTRR